MLLTKSATKAAVNSVRKAVVRRATTAAKITAAGVGVGIGVKLYNEADSSSGDDRGSTTTDEVSENSNGNNEGGGDDDGQYGYDKSKLNKNRGNKDVRRKPGSLGKFKGRDGLRRENGTPADAANRAGLDRGQQQKLHREISGRELKYDKILEIAREIKKGLL